MSWLTARISPVRPTSADGGERIGRRLVQRGGGDGDGDGQIGRRLVQPQSADDVQVDVRRAEPQAAALFQHGQQHGGAVIVIAVARAARHVVGRLTYERLHLGKDRRVPSITQATQVPGVPSGRPASSSSEGFGTSRRPRSSISNTPISFVEPKRFFAARSRR